MKVFELIAQVALILLLAMVSVRHGAAEMDTRGVQMQDNVTGSTLLDATRLWQHGDAHGRNRRRTTRHKHANAAPSWNSTSFIFQYGKPVDAPSPPFCNHV